MRAKIRLFPKKIIYFALYFVILALFLSFRRPEGGRILIMQTWMSTRFFATLRYALNDKWCSGIDKESNEQNNK